VLSLAGLAALVTEHGDPSAYPVSPLQIGTRAYDVDASPVLMGCVNLSRDSTYRDSVAVGVASAVRRARVMAAEGAAFVDLGAESSTAAAARVSAKDQSRTLVPIVEALTSEGIAVSVETYEPTVAEAALSAGAAVLNLTGTQHQEAMLELVAEHQATVILCYGGGANVREITDVQLDGDPLPELLDHFASRLEHARARGVDRVVIDPGMGFYYGNLTDPMTRARHQARVLLTGYRLRELGVPICNALPHAFDLFEEQFRGGEAFFAVWAVLGGTSVLRTHEVARVRPVVAAMRELSTVA
jgi:dihydropteroate synthase